MKWSFWNWLLIGLEGRPGYRKFWNIWLVVHVLLGILIAKVVEIPVSEAAQTILLPMAGIFVGLSCAWIGIAIALLREPEIELLSEHHPDGVETYVYTFQLAVLVILMSLVCWGLAGLEIFDFEAENNVELSFALETTLYFLASLTLRECWQIVVAGQILVLIQRTIRASNRTSPK